MTMYNIKSELTIEYSNGETETMRGNFYALVQVATAFVHMNPQNTVKVTNGRGTMTLDSKGDKWEPKSAAKAGSK